MSTERPFSAVVRPRGPAFVLKFARELLPLFEGSNTITATPSEQGLHLDCLWEPDLEWAAEQIQSAFSADLSWSQPKIKYLTDTVGGREIVLEPMLKVHVRTPEEFCGTVMGDLSSRRGMILGMDDVDGDKLVHAQVPLSELRGYSRTLAAITNTRAMATAEFDSYQEAPRRPGTDPNEPMSAALRA
jgi:translation elongation factor EF-G